MEKKTAEERVGCILLTEETKPRFAYSKAQKLYNQLISAKDERERDILKGKLLLLILGYILPTDTGRSLMMK